MIVNFECLLLYYSFSHCQSLLVRRHVCLLSSSANASLLIMSPTTSIHLDPGEQWNYLSPQAIPPNVPTTGEDSVVIAPWLEEPVSANSFPLLISRAYLTHPVAQPTPQKQKPATLNTKRSVMNFVSARQGSTTSLVRTGRPSESGHSFCDSISSSGTERQSNADLRKPKSMNMFNVIKKKVSRIGKDENAGSSNGANNGTPVVPPLPSPLPSQSFLPIQVTPPPMPRRRRRNRPKSPGPASWPPKEQEFTLDTNLDEMDGIVDLTVRNNDVKGILANDNASASSPGSGFESSYQSSSWSASDVSFHPLVPSPPPHVQLNMQPAIFSNPFLPNATITASAHAATHRRRGVSHLDNRKISPKTPLPKPPEEKPVEVEKRDGDPGWAAPESWAVEKEGGFPDVPDYTDSEASDSMGAVERSQNVKQQRRRTKNPKRTQSVPSYQIRIHRSDGTYHVVKCPLTTTVAELVPVMNHKLFLDETREPHSLYVKERERGMLCIWFS